MLHIFIVLFICIKSLVEVGYKSNSTELPTFVNVLQYGAVGDGINDDTNAIQKCLNENKNVFFPKGIYKVKYVTITNRGGVIRGAGQNTTVIKSSGDINTSVMEVKSSDVTISEICVDGNGIHMPKPNKGDGAQCLTVVNGNGFRVANSKFVNAYNKTMTIISSSNCIIENNYFESYGRKNQNQDFLQIYGGVSRCYNNKILNNRFYNPIRSCIYLDMDVSNTLIENNIFINKIGDDGAAAIIGQGYGSNLIIKKNYSENCKYFVYLRSGYGNSEISENEIYKVRNSALFIYGANKIYSLIKKSEPNFSTIEKLNNKRRDENSIIFSSIKFENNIIDFSKQLLETSTAAVSIFGSGDAYFKCRFERIVVRRNFVKKTDFAIKAFIVTSLNKGELLDSLVVENNTFKQPANYFMFNYNNEPTSKKVINNISN